MNIFNVLLKLLNGSKYVKQQECHKAQDRVHQRIDDFDKHMSERFDDMKAFIIKNGK